jgi:hypothetical protein
LRSSPYCVGKLGSSSFRHLHVRHDQPGAETTIQECECLLRVARGCDGISLGGQEVDEQRADMRVIINDQDIGQSDSGLCHHRFRPARGVPTRRCGGGSRSSGWRCPPIHEDRAVQATGGIAKLWQAPARKR